MKLEPEGKKRLGTMKKTLAGLLAAVAVALAGAARVALGMPVVPESALPPWGSTAENPVRMASISGEYAWLARLRTADGRPVRALRRDAVFVNGFEGPLDVWSVAKGDGEYADLWIYGYGPGNAMEAPEGFLLDTDGFARELARFPPDTPSPSRETPMRSVWSPEPNGSEADERGTAEVAGVRVPPPDGYVPVASRQGWEAWVERSWTAVDAIPGRTPGSGPVEKAVFGLDMPTMRPQMLAVAFVHPEGEATPEEFAERTRRLKESLYEMGMRSGMRAPHRETERTFQWTVQRPEPFNGFEIATCARLWVGGRALELICGWIHEGEPAYLAGDILGSRAAMDAWVAKILRANGETE